jgi:hypothetical protein
MKKKKKLKVKAKKKAFGGYAVCFKGCDDTIEDIMGSEPIAPSEMTKRLWKYVKKNGLGTKDGDE